MSSGVGERIRHAVAGTDESFDPRAGLQRIAAVGAVGAGLVGVYAVTGLGVPCPFHRITGWWCPACGGTRAGAALVRGDVAGAVAWNPLAVVALVVVAVCGVLWTGELLGGRAWRPFRRWGGATQSRVYLVAGLASVVFVLLRNLLA